MKRIQTRPLTAAEQKLVEDNHQLIHGFAYARGIDYDEWYGALAWGLCIAAQKYEPSRGEFSTVAYWWMSSIMSRELVKKRRMCRSATSISLSALGCNDDGDTYEVGTKLGHECKELSNVELATCVEQVKASMTSRMQKTCTLLGQGYTERDIAEKVGITYQRVHQLKESMRKDFAQLAEFGG